MDKEKLQRPQKSHGVTVRVEGIRMTSKKAQALCFPNFDPALDDMQLCAIGFDSQGNVTGIVPTILNEEELRYSKIDRVHYEDTLQIIANSAKKEFGL